jgi:putative redox protein
MSETAKPGVMVELIWAKDLQFGVRTASHALVLDGDTKAGPSPVELLVAGLAGCMSIDVADIIQKGRHRLTGLRSELKAERRPDAPRRVTKVDLAFHVLGDVPPQVVERAIALSRDKYCSVWHSLRTDIELTTTFTAGAGN